MASVTISGLTVAVGESRLLGGIDLAIADGDFMVLMGPSGAGKTTLLRAVAGLEQPQSGDVWIGRHRVGDGEKGGPRVGMMFQDNVLFPFASAGANVAFPLEVRGLSRAEVDRRVRAEARVLAIEELLDRKPQTLSAGYQQLVQAARAMVQVPDVFLMDEPVAQMDPALRETARRELSILQRGYGVTTLWATNDPVEAMAIADRIVVLHEGSISGEGSPADLYAEPGTEVIAQTIGVPPMRIVRAIVAARGDEYEVVAGDLRFRIDGRGFRRLAPGAVHLGVRPEDIVLHPGGVVARVIAHEYHGDHQILEIEPGDLRLAMRVVGDAAPAPGETVQIAVKRAHFFDPLSGVAVAHATYRSGRQF
jgi:ABC-type sugar transport system ATPase subunit